MIILSQLPLSQFPSGETLTRLTIKNSKGLEKRLRLGAPEYVAQSFVIRMNQFDPGNTFVLQPETPGKIIFSQSPDGNIMLDVSRHITIPFVTSEPTGDYLYFSRRKYIGKKKVLEQGYIPLQIIERRNL